MEKPDNKRLLESYLRHIHIAHSVTNQLFVIGFIGVVGSGKSTVAKRLSELTGVYSSSNDAIRRFLNEQGFDGDAPMQETVQYIAEHTTDYLFAHKISHIIDADIIKFHEAVRAKVEKAGAKLYLVEVSCPDEVIRHRIEERLKDGSGHSRAGLEEYEQRKLIHREIPKPDCDFVVRTNEPLEPQLQLILDGLQADGVIA